MMHLGNNFIWYVGDQAPNTRHLFGEVQADGHELQFVYDKTPIRPTEEPVRKFIGYEAILIWDALMQVKRDDEEREG